MPRHRPPPPPPVPFSRRSRAFHGEAPADRQAWAVTQRRMLLGQRDFNELWEETPRQRPATRRDASPAAAAPCPMAGAPTKREREP
jgi:hypothetical protein